MSFRAFTVGYTTGVGVVVDLKGNYTSVTVVSASSTVAVSAINSAIMPTAPASYPADSLSTYGVPIEYALMGSTSAPFVFGAEVLATKSSGGLGAFDTFTHLIFYPKDTAGVMVVKCH